MVKKRKSGFKQWLLIYGWIPLLILLFFSGTIWGIFGVHIPYSEGERMGTIIKFSEKGLFWKSYEGDMVVRTSAISYGDFWKFSIDNNAPNKAQLVAAIQSAFENQQIVIIHYEQKAGTVPWRGKTSYFITEVTVVE